MQTPESSRLNHLDMLRGLAALGVVLYHCLTAANRYQWPIADFEKAFQQFFIAYLNLGKIGVVVFFIVSGLVIPASLLRSKKQPLKKFLVGRIARLYPAYWVSIIGAVGALTLIGSQPIVWPDIFTNFTMLQQFIGVPNLLSVYWTLQIEIIFYLLCVGLYLCNMLKNTQLISAIVILNLLGALVGAIIRDQLELKLPIALPLGLACMFLGILLRQAYLENNPTSKKHLIWLMGVWVICMPFIAWFAYRTPNEFGETGLGYLLSYFVGLAAVWGVVACPRYYGKVLAWLGEISYSVYLLHGIMISLLTWYWVPSSLLAFGFVTVLFTVFVSAVVFYAVEKPCIAYGRYIMQKEKK